MQISCKCPLFCKCTDYVLPCSLELASEHCNALAAFRFHSCLAAGHVARFFLEGFIWFSHQIKGKKSKRTPQFRVDCMTVQWWCIINEIVRARARGGRHWQPINGRERKEEEKKLVCFAQESSELAQCVWVFCTQFTLINFHSGRPSQTYKESFKIKLPRFLDLILIYFRRKMQFEGTVKVS